MSTPREEFENAARPLARELIDYAMQAGAAAGITDVEIAISRSREQSTKIEGGQVRESVGGTSWGVSITLYAGDRIVSFGQNSLDTAALKAAIDKNLEIMPIVPENPFGALPERQYLYHGQKQDLDLFDHSPPRQEDLIAYAVAAEAAATSLPGIKALRSNSIDVTQSFSLRLATNGLDRVAGRTSYDAGLLAIAEDENGMQIDGEGSRAAHFSDMLDPAALGRSAAEQALAKLSPSLPQSGEADIILSPEAAAGFFATVMQAIDGAALYRKATFLKDSLGQQVVNASVTIEDDPRIPRALGSRNTDSAGMEARKITFIEQGVLKQFNVSLEEANKLGMMPIGRNDGYTNLRVLPGEKSPEELMADIKDGFYIKGFKGGTADVNTGRFSRQAYGNVIRDGKITDEAVAGFVVSGNLRDMFMKAVVANDTPSLPDPRHAAAVPSLRLDGMKIAGR